MLSVAQKRPVYDVVNGVAKHGNHGGRGKLKQKLSYGGVPQRVDLLRAAAVVGFDALGDIRLFVIILRKGSAPALVVTVTDCNRL